MLKVVVQDPSSRPPPYAHVQPLSHCNPKQQQQQQQVQQHPSIKQGSNPYVFQEFSPDPSPTSANSSFFKDPQTQKRQQDYLSTLSSSLPPTYPNTIMETKKDMAKLPLSDPRHSALPHQHPQTHPHHHHRQENYPLKKEKKSPPALPIFIPDAAFLHRHRRSSHTPLPKSPSLLLLQPPPPPSNIFLKRRSSCPALGSNTVYLPFPGSLVPLLLLNPPLKSIGTGLGTCRPDVALESFNPPSQIWSSSLSLSLACRDGVTDPLAPASKRIATDPPPDEPNEQKQQEKKRRRLLSSHEFVNR